MVPPIQTEYFQLVLLLDSVAVGRSLGGVDQLVGQALGDRLDVPEGGLTGAGAAKPDGLIDPPEGTDVDGLTTDGTGATDMGRVLTGSGVDDGVNQNLDWVVSGQEVDDFEAVLDDPDCQELLAVVAAVHHEGV